MTYQYDQTFKGALYSVSNTAGNGTAYGHDALGRVTSSTQTTAGYTYPAMAYDYNLADQLTSITYPSGRKVTYNLDSSGRISSVGGVLLRNGVTVSSAYASALQYAAHGGLTGMSLGSGHGETYSWNDRLQQTGVSTGSLLTLSFAPCVGGGTVCSNNNGNIRQQTITMPGASATQQYLYDSVNRLVQASENNTSCTAGGSAWCQHFAYDVAGNRRMDQSAGYGISLWEVSAFNPANNRISNANWGYDDTGNIKQNPCGETISYDAENRQVAFNRSTAACGAPAGVSSYVYDGLGQRVARTDVSGRQTVFVYDAFGNLAAEYNPAGAPVDRTQYVTVDQLGSTRLVTGASGTERHDYHPFGFEAIGGWRTAGLGYGASGPVRQQFTGAEHDSESGLNFLQARYLSTPQGRFTSVDPGNAGAMLGDPQSWNGYAYVSNNPLNYTDPSGLGFWSTMFHGTMWLWNNTIGRMTVGQLAFGTGIPGVGGIPSLGDLTACGGAFGNCGGLHEAPWSEQLPIAQVVRHAELFVLDMDKACAATGLRAVIANAEGTDRDSDGGHGRVARGKVIAAPQRFASLIGTSNATIEDPSSLSGHPNILVQAGARRTTAFGRYQILAGTAANYGFTDFSPAGQDAAADLLMSRRRMLGPALQGNVARAIRNGIESGPAYLDRRTGSHEYQWLRLCAYFDRPQQDANTSWTGVYS